jgi:hypothetical protein
MGYTIVYGNRLDETLNVVIFMFTVIPQKNIEMDKSQVNETSIRKLLVRNRRVPCLIHS